jgi:hypothetical protein
MNLESDRLGTGLCETVYAKNESHAIAAERVLPMKVPRKEGEWSTTKKVSKWAFERWGFD